MRNDYRGVCEKNKTTWGEVGRIIRQSSEGNRAEFSCEDLRLVVDDSEGDYGASGRVIVAQGELGLAPEWVWEDEVGLGKANRDKTFAYIKEADGSCLEVGARVRADGRVSRGVEMSR